MAFKPLESLSAELNLFEPPIVESGCLAGDYVEFKPLQALGDGPIEFFITPSNDKYIALDRTLLKIAFTKALLPLTLKTYARECSLPASS
jgi:hypothetical protein